ncbi:MAG: M48 family metallopeptidase [Gemmatimonadota bacterium]|nr:M48 family metallopeptidase [Gemmatimonadota bacterium]
MKRLSLIAPLIALAACSVSQDQEVAIGKQNADQINAQLPIIGDPAISSYIQTLGDSIAKTTSRADLAWHFYVVNTKQVNAFALPGGYVYVNRGLIETADRLDELAGTLGHEIGHVIQRHSVKQIQSQEKTNAGLAVVCTLTSLCHSGLAQAAVSVGGSALFARHSRADELQADSEAVVNTTRAGFDPEGIPALFDALLKQRQYQPTKVEGWFASHPLEEQRIQRARDLISALPAGTTAQLVRDDQAFHDFKARISALPVPPKMELIDSGAARPVR